MCWVLTAFLHSGYKAGQGDLWGQLDHGRRRRRSHRHWSSNTQRSRRSSRETERGLEVVNRERVRQNKNKKTSEEREKVQKQNETKSSWASETVHEASLPVIFCAALFRAGTRSSHLRLWIYLVSICFKSKAKGWKQHQVFLIYFCCRCEWHNELQWRGDSGSSRRLLSQKHLQAELLLHLDPALNQIKCSLVVRVWMKSNICWVNLSLYNLFL